MGLKQLTGTPWHIEKLTRQEGDERRHRSRCVFLKKEQNYCKKVVGKCCGSAHCPYYEESSEKPVAELKPKSPTVISREEISKLFPVNTRVKHNDFGEGTVKAIEGNILIIVFDQGEEKKMSFEICTRKNLLKPID